MTLSDLLDITLDLLDEKRTNTSLRNILKPFINEGYKEVYDRVDSFKIHSEELSDYTLTLPSDLDKIINIKINTYNVPNYIIENNTLRTGYNSGTMDILYKPNYTPLINELDTVTLKEEYKTIPCFYAAAIYCEIDDEFSKAQRFENLYHRGLGKIAKGNIKHGNVNFINVW